MPNEKIRLTKQEFEDMYQIEDETTETITEKLVTPEIQEEEFLTKEEQVIDKELFDTLETPEVEEK